VSDVSSADALRRLGLAAARLRLSDLPPQCIQRARQRVLDTLACLVAGYREGISDQIREYVNAQGGRAEATLLPRGTKTTAALAGLAHAAYIFGLELSDAAPRGTVHPGSEIVSAALAMAEREGLGGAAIIPALVAGYEVEIRFGRALHPSAFYKGWSTIGLLGAIGPAVTAAHLLRLDAVRMANAIGIAVQLAPAATGRANQPATVKWLLGGHACATGQLAAEMAARGVTGSAALDAWLKVISGEAQPERLVEGIAADGAFTQWELLSGIVTKYYAVPGPLAAPIEAMFMLIEQHAIGSGDIEEIHVDCTRRTAIFKQAQPSNELEARGSLPFCLALAARMREPALLLGAGFRDAMTRDPALQALAARVRITANEDYERQYPARSLARISVRLRDGTVHGIEVDRSEIGRYLSPTDADIEAKFRSIAAPVLGESRVGEVVAIARGLEGMVNVDALMKALQP
jgi:2-methylcitrate dehydratase PrpD